MDNRDKRIDHYIANAASFAQPVLPYLRELVHAVCPDVHEIMKWSMPFFEYKDGIVCWMAAFTKHCAFGFWQAAQMSDPKKILETDKKTAMGSFGKITSINDLPAEKILIRYIREAVKLTRIKQKAGTKS